MFTILDFSSSGTVVSGVAGYKIRVLSATMDANNGSVTTYFTSSTGPTQLIGNLFLSSGTPGEATATGDITLPYSPIGWFETAEGDNLDIVLEGEAGVGGCIVYELVQP